MYKTQRLERPGKQAIETATVPAVGGAGKFAGLAAPALAKRGVKIRGLAPNAKQGGIVREHGGEEIAIGGLPHRAGLDAARRDGRIVNFGSASVFEGMPGHAHDVAARAGVAGFTRSIARELGADAPIQRDEVPEDLVGTTF